MPDAVNLELVVDALRARSIHLQRAAMAASTDARSIPDRIVDTLASAERLTALADDLTAGALLFGRADI